MTTDNPALPSVLWLHTQPEHYHNRMMDDLARAGRYRFVAGFMFQGPGVYTQSALPVVAETIFLEPRMGGGRAERPAKFFEKYHKDWQGQLRLEQFSAVIVSGYGSRTAREVIAECRRKNIPVAMWTDSNLRSQHGRGFKARLKRRLKKAWLSTVVGGLDYVLAANSRGIAYWRYYGVPKNKIVLCPCYSDYPRIEAARQTPRVQVLAKFNLSQDTKLLFTAARLVPAKALDTMIKAFIAGNFAAEGWKYFIAGQGPLETELRALASPAGDAIRFVGFQQPSDNLALIAHANLFVLPSRYEPHGIVVPEAMAGGTPVLASNVTGAAIDLVIPGISGDTFRADDTADLIAKLHNLLDDPTRLAAMRTGARGTFEEWFRTTSPITVTNRLVDAMIMRRGNCLE